MQSWRFPVHTPCQFFIIRPQILFFSLISLNIDLFNVTSHLCFSRIFLGDRQLHEEIFTNENISWFQNHSSLSYGSCPFRSQTEWKLWRSVCNGIGWIQEARIEIFCLCKQRQKLFLSLPTKTKKFLSLWAKTKIISILTSWDGLHTATRTGQWCKSQTSHKKILVKHKKWLGTLKISFQPWWLKSEKNTRK